MGTFIDSEFESRDFHPTVRRIWNLLWFQQGSCKGTRKSLGHNELKKAKPLFTSTPLLKPLQCCLRVKKKMMYILLCAVKNQSKLPIQLKAGGRLQGKVV